MAKQSDLLKNFRVASPCHVGWETMSGDDQVRFCDSCHLHVYNFSEMTSDEITSLITQTEGRLCGRMYRRTDGTVITRDCPVGLRAVRQRISRVASAAFATLISACSFAFAQTPKQNTSCKQIPALALERKKPANNQAPAFKGTVFDWQEALIRGTEVRLLDSKGQTVRETTADDVGAFSFFGVPEGTYTLEVFANGFKKLIVKKLELSADEIAIAKITLDVDINVEMGVVVSGTDALIKRNDGTTTIPGDVIRKLPINN
jgi:hypothetical protein